MKISQQFRGRGKFTRIFSRRSCEKKNKKGLILIINTIILKRDLLEEKGILSDLPLLRLGLGRLPSLPPILQGLVESLPEQVSDV